ncbi:RICIN domain-containing protein [Kitasatospora sp. NPDC088346]|uniref:RICIN domain-containing protein n=1 Tax=Kitasatospora sp. NPDC088346 TaxID=3364073 RepID=UPI00382F31FD
MISRKSVALLSGALVLLSAPLTAGPAVAAGTSPAASGQNAVAGNWLIHTFNGKCVEVENSQTGNGATVQQWDCVGQAGSGWYGEWHGSYEYVKNSHSGKCLEVENSQTGNGARIQQWDCLGQEGSKWYPVDAGNGYVNLVNYHSGKCLEVENSQTGNGARIQQWDCVGQAGSKLYTSAA